MAVRARRLAENTLNLKKTATKNQKQQQIFLTFRGKRIRKSECYFGARFALFLSRTWDWGEDAERGETRWRLIASAGARASSGIGRAFSQVRDPE